jgi:alpha-tubulin suppressor-like RCC1 family protein
MNTKIFFFLIFIIKFANLWETLSLGGDFSLTLNSNGDLYYYGKNFYSKSNEFASPTFTKINILNNIKKITTGYQSTLALTKNNELYFLGTTIDKYGNKIIISNPILYNNIFKNKKIKLFAISKSYSYFSVIVLENEEIYILGSFSEEEYSNPMQINTNGILKNKKIKQISAGNDFVLILCEDNTLVFFF